jgi:integrase
MATIRKRGNYSWEVQVRRRGYPSQTKTFDTRREAEAWGRMTEREMDSGSFLSRTAAERTTISDIVKKYREELLPRQRGKRQEESRLNFVDMKFGAFCLSGITSEAVAKWRDELLVTRSAQTCVHYLGVLSRLYRAAERDFGIPLPLGNPVKAIRTPSIANSRERRLVGDESTRLDVALANSRSKCLYDVSKLALETAMRRGELLNLKWDHIDLQKRVLHIPITKNGLPRDVPLSNAAVKLLTDLPRNISGRVFSTSETAITEGFQRAVIRAGINDFRFHDLRHEATSRLAEKLQMHELMKVTGHQSSRMLARYYHPRAEDLAQKIM